MTLYNKCDRPDCGEGIRDFQADETLAVSAVTGQGLDRLQERLAGILQNRKIYVERFFLYPDAGKIQLIRRYGQLMQEEYREEGIAVAGYVPAQIAQKL